MWTLYKGFLTSIFLLTFLNYICCIFIHFIKYFLHLHLHFFFIRYFLNLHFKCYHENLLYLSPSLLPNPNYVVFFFKLKNILNTQRCSSIVKSLSYHAWSTGFDS
jgi:hypothetical protein